MARRPKLKRVILKIQHRRLHGRGFGCYFRGSAVRGEARIIIDCDALAWSEAEASGRIAFKRHFIDSAGHEFMHALEDLFGLMFNEKAVEAAIRTARKGRSR